MAGTNGTVHNPIYGGNGEILNSPEYQQARADTERMVRNRIFADGNDGMNEDRSDGLDAPHWLTYGAIFRGAAHTYNHLWDEAIKHNRLNALAMRRDCWLMSLLRERCDGTLHRKWRLNCDNPKDPWQKNVMDGITKILETTPHLKRMHRYTLQGSLWYGRYGSNIKWEWDNVMLPAMDKSGQAGTSEGGGPMMLSSGPVEPKWEKHRVIRMVKHKPINGDKIGHHQDDTPYVMVSSSWRDKFRGRPEIIYPSSAGSAALLLRGNWREQMFIAESDPDDMDFFEAELAESVHGVGIRSRIYWLDFMRRDYIGWITDTLERIGLGLVVIYYDAGNETAKKEAEKTAKYYSRRSAITIPRSPESNWSGGSVEVVEGPTAGITAVQELIKHTEDQIERYINFQTVSSGGGTSNPLEGSGRSDFAADTKIKGCMGDAEDFAESFTGDKENPGPIYTIKKWCYPFADFPVWMEYTDEPTDAEKTAKMIVDFAGLGVGFKEDEVRDLVPGMTRPGPEDEIVGGKEALAAQQEADAAGAFGGHTGGDGKTGDEKAEPGKQEPEGDLKAPDEFKGGWKLSSEVETVHYAEEGMTHWVTLGGHPGAEGKHQGGFHVQIDGNGVIVKSGGPQDMVGKHIGYVPGDFKKLESEFTPEEEKKMGHVRTALEHGGMGAADVENFMKEEKKRVLGDRKTAKKSPKKSDPQNATKQITGPPTEEVFARVREALKGKLGGEGKRILLKDVRKHFSDISHETMTDALRQLSRNKEISLMHMDDPRQIKQEDVDAAIHSSTGDPNHLLYFGGHHS